MSYCSLAPVNDSYAASHPFVDLEGQGHILKIFVLIIGKLQNSQAMLSAESSCALQQVSMQ